MQKTHSQSTKMLHKLQMANSNPEILMKQYSHFTLIWQQDGLNYKKIYENNKKI